MKFRRGNARPSKRTHLRNHAESAVCDVFLSGGCPASAIDRLRQSTDFFYDRPRVATVLINRANETERVAPFDVAQAWWAQSNHEVRAR